MSKRLEGGFLTARPTWSTAATPGVWASEQHFARVYASGWPSPTALFDPYFESVSLLLHMNGSNGSTTFVDSSLGNLAVTANGNAQISTAQSKFGGSSGLFDGNGDFLTASSPNLNADWTVEFWVYPSVASQQTLISFNSGSNQGINIWMNASRQLVADDGANAQSAFTGALLALNTWSHIAIVRSGATTTGYINGVSVGSNSFVPQSINAVNIGRYNGGVNQYFFNGYLDEVRVTQGVARYTTNFVVPNVGYDEGAALYDPYFDYVSLLLRCNGENNSTTFTDSSNNALTVTANGNAKISTAQARFGGASVYLDGAGDFLAIGTQSSFNFLHNGSNWTIELWIKPDNYLATRTILDTAIGSSVNVGIYIGLNSDRTISVGTFRGVSGSFVLTGTFAGVVPNDNNWHHIAITYDHSKASANAMLYIDGSSQGSITKTANAPSSANATRQMYVGTFTGSTEFYLGYIDDLRITNGVVRYTTSFRPVGPYATSGKLVDPYLTNTSLLLPMTGDNNTTSFFDRSNNFLRATENGNAKVSTTISKFGGTSAYFDGTGDYLALSNPNLYSFGTGDFTVEAWIYRVTPVTYSALLEVGNHLNADSVLFLIGTGGIQLYSAGFYGSGTLSTGVWQHVAWSRSSGTLRTFVDGQLTSTTAFSNNLTSSTQASVGYSAGNNGGANYYHNGYIDDLRITKGTARYTTAFTPPERAFNDEAFNDPDYNNVSLLLHMDGTNNSTTFTDSSVNGLTVTANGDAKISTAQSRFGGASALFDGTGDYLSAPSSALFDLGVISASTNFTAECWAYRTSGTAAAMLMAHGMPGSGGNGIGGWVLWLQDGAVYIYMGRNTNTPSPWVLQAKTPDNTALNNQWSHIAFVMSSGVVQIYVNGVQQSLTYTTGAIWGSSAIGWDTSKTNYGLIVGASATDSVNPSPSQFFTGYIDDLRVTRGIARYTSNFTPPTLPFYNTTIPTVDPSFSSVSLLLHMNGTNGSTTFTDSSSNALAVTANGNAQISTAQSKFGGASGAFDGNGDYLTLADSALWDFPADFTIEAWVRASATGFGPIVSTRNAGAAVNPVLYLWDTGVLAWYYNTAARITGTTNIVGGSFYHVAVCRSSGSARLFVNGIQEGATYVNSDSYVADGIWIGSIPASNQHFNGYIDDLRITKGVARYTSNFYIPRAAFPDA